MNTFINVTILTVVQQDCIYDSTLEIGQEPMRRDSLISLLGGFVDSYECLVIVPVLQNFVDPDIRVDFPSA